MTRRPTSASEAHSLVPVHQTRAVSAAPPSCHDVLITYLGYSERFRLVFKFAVYLICTDTWPLSVNGWMNGWMKLRWSRWWSVCASRCECCFLVTQRWELCSDVAMSGQKWILQLWVNLSTLLSWFHQKVRGLLEPWDIFEGDWQGRCLNSPRPATSLQKHLDGSRFW